MFLDIPLLPSMAALALAARAEKAQDERNQGCPAQDMCGPVKCQHGPAGRACDANKCSVPEKVFDNFPDSAIP